MGSDIEANENESFDNMEEDELQRMEEEMAANVAAEEEEAAAAEADSDMNDFW